jgi:hypothetical protein
VSLPKVLTIKTPKFLLNGRLQKKKRGGGFSSLFHQKQKIQQN